MGNFQYLKNYKITFPPKYSPLFFPCFNSTWFRELRIKIINFYHGFCTHIAIATCCYITRL
jgi:hypothetical protein